MFSAIIILFIYIDYIYMQPHHIFIQSYLINLLFSTIKNKPFIISNLFQTNFHVNQLHLRLNRTLHSRSSSKLNSWKRKVIIVQYRIIVCIYLLEYTAAVNGENQNYMYENY